VQNFLYGDAACSVLKLADFGLSQLILDGNVLSSVCGSPAFMAPEMMLKQGYDFKIDLWALGVTFFMVMYNALLVGRSKMNVSEMKDAIKDPAAGQRALALATNKANASSEGVKELKLAAIDLIGKLTLREPAQRLSAKQALKEKFVAWTYANEEEIAFIQT
ncbi:unnamed protein product, partial [Polarella glacialis]